MKTCTVEDVLSWEPCEGYEGQFYNRPRLLRLFANRERLTVVDMLRLDIPTNDRLWAVLRPGMISVKTAQLWAAWCAEQALLGARRVGWEPDNRSWAAVDVARQHAADDISEEVLATVRDASWYAASKAASEAARATAAAARSAARATARIDARVAVIDFGGFSADDVARDAWAAAGTAVTIMAAREAGIAAVAAMAAVTAVTFGANWATARATAVAAAATVGDAVGDAQIEKLIEMLEEK